MKMTRRNFLSASRPHTAVLPAGPAARADCLCPAFSRHRHHLPPKPLTAKVVDANPFMGRKLSQTSTTTATTPTPPTPSLPVGICPRSSGNGKDELTPPRPSSSTTSITPSARSSAVWPSVTSTQKSPHHRLFSPPSTTAAAIIKKLLFLCGRAQPHRLPHQPQPCADASCRRKGTPLPVLKGTGHQHQRGRRAGCLAAASSRTCSPSSSTTTATSGSSPAASASTPAAASRAPMGYISTTPSSTNHLRFPLPAVLAADLRRSS